MQNITIEVLIPWLEGRSISERQLDAVQTAIHDLNIATEFDGGAATLIHRDTLINVLEVIDEHPHKDHSPVAFRKCLQQEVLSTGVKYWMIGADTLPLEE